MRFLQKLSLIAFLCFYNLNAQKITFAKAVTENQITTFDNQKLILLDFWATWCGPCVTATKQMEFFQDTNKDKVFIFSVTDENESIVKKYLTKKPITLMVVLDLDKTYIEKYRITSRPYAVLLDLDGNELWKGHPGDLNQSKLDDFYYRNKNHSKVSFADAVTIEQGVNETKIVDYKYVDFELKRADNAPDSFVVENNKVHFSGKLSKLISKLNQKSLFEIEITPELNCEVDLVCDTSNWKNAEDIEAKIKNKFNLSFQTIEKEQNAIELFVENKDLLWDKSQIIWEDSSAKFLEGTDRIKANDVSINEIAQIISESKNQNYIYLGSDLTVYDWDFNFLYEDLMKEDFSSTFGIGMKPITVSRNVIKISEE
jgi:thiol-disulfide isomerase/thioredoxin